MEFPEAHFLDKRCFTVPEHSSGSSSPLNLVRASGSWNDPLCVDTGASLCAESAGFSRDPDAPQRVSLPVGAESNRGHGALLCQRGHATLRPCDLQDFLCHLIIQDPHEQGFGNSRGSVYTAARNSNFPWKERRRAFGFPVLSLRFEKVLLIGHLFRRGVPLSPQPPLRVQKKEHFISDPGITVRILPHLAVLVGTALPAARFRRREIPGTWGRGSPAPRLERKLLAALLAAGRVCEIWSPAGTRGPHSSMRAIHPVVLPRNFAANARPSSRKRGTDGRGRGLARPASRDSDWPRPLRYCARSPSLRTFKGEKSPLPNTPRPIPPLPHPTQPPLPHLGSLFVFLAQQLWSHFRVSPLFLLCSILISSPSPFVSRYGRHLDCTHTPTSSSKCQAQSMPSFQGLSLEWRNKEVKTKSH